MSLIKLKVLFLHKFSDMVKDNNTLKKISENTERQKVMPFSKKNYIIVLIGIAFIALGFIFTRGGGSTDPNVFNEKMFDFRHITLAPIMVLSGFVIEIVAIFWRDKK